MTHQERSLLVFTLQSIRRACRLVKYLY